MAPDTLAVPRSQIRAEWLVLLAAMGFPSLLAWFEFVYLAHGGEGANPVQQISLLVGKTIQFAWPLAALWLLERRWPTLSLPSGKGLLMGTAFGLAAAAGMLGLYFGWWRDVPAFAETPAMVRNKLAEFGFDTLTTFLLFAGFLSVVHSLLEEYYWRWFVFGRLRQFMPLAGAIVLSSLAFMAHHVIVLSVYFPGEFWLVVMPFSLAVAIGGACWAWLYHRTGSLYGAWVSHILVDAAIMVVGYDMAFGSG